MSEVFDDQNGEGVVHPLPLHIREGNKRGRKKIVRPCLRIFDSAPRISFRFDFISLLTDDKAGQTRDAGRREEKKSCEGFHEISSLEGRGREPMAARE